ncbi:MAG: nucleotide sugar dehydrogenase [Sporichthyaceae bacterium]|nr:nucleotide sugar dehydrogenase [Sporichthyaceae bacterium]
MSGEPVAVIGLWHLGSVAAAGWAALDRQVTAWDPDPALRDMLRAGRGPVTEPRLDELLAEGGRRGRLTVTDTPGDAIRGRPVVHVAFDSRVDEHGRVADDRIAAAVDEVARAGAPGCLLMLGSQVRIGTGRELRGRLCKAGRGDVRLAYVPENLRLGGAVADFLHPSRLVVGVDDEPSWIAAEAAVAGIETPALIRMDLPSAEMVKHATNAYLGLCIAFANELAYIGSTHGARSADVIAALRADPRVSPLAPLRPGEAFSGATLRRDLRALADASGAGPNLFAEVLAVNEHHAGRLLEVLREELGGLAGRRLAVLGLAYKAGTSTLRDSLPVWLIRRMLDEGAAEVRGYDLFAEPVPDPPAGFRRAATLAECVASADAVVVLSAIADATGLVWLDLPGRPRLAVDGCGALDAARVRAAGWRYRGVG